MFDTMSPMDKWTQYAEKLKADMAHAQPSISMTRVMLLFGLVSKSSAFYILKKLERMGVVKHDRGRWYIK